MEKRPRLKILIVDDDEDDLFLTSDVLEGIDVLDLVIETESNYQKASKKILLNEHDVYLIDYLMGAKTGIDLIRQSVEAGISKPFILLTGKGDRKIDMEATQAGAYDYLTKPELNAELIERSLRYSMQRYSAFKTLAESENRYREIFIRSNDIILVIDQNFCLINFNPMTSTLLGYSGEELLGQPLSVLFDNSNAATDFVERIKTDAAKNNVEINLVTKMGLPIAFLASCSQTSYLNGSEQYQIILHDYTVLKKSMAEQLLREKIETTERLVRSLAHEIRNPLTAINLSLHQLQSELTNETQPLTDIIKRNSNRINDVIGDLMNISNPVNKIEEDIESAYLLRTVLSLAKDRLELKQIKVIENYRAHETYVKGDYKKLQIALLNIVINAIEAMEFDKGQLDIETSVDDDILTIKIKDNGSGIIPENIPYLFQPYFTNKKNGIGLGLATAHSFILAHKGSIEVISEKGNGTTFIVKLKAVLPQNSRMLKPSDKEVGV